MARDHWGLDAAAAWAAVQQQAALGRLRGYRGTGDAFDLMRASLGQVRLDHELFVEPTEVTFARLAELHSA
jgi:hypothetical protein